MKPSIILSINTAWNFVNFRSGLLQRLVQEGFDVVAVAPPDGEVERLRALGVRFVPIAMDRKGLSPVGDLALLARYRRVIRETAPVAYLGWTIKPNIWGSMAARMAGVPVINNISGLGTAFMKRGGLQALVRRLYRLALRRSSTVFFQNPDDRSAFLAWGIVDADRSQVLPGSGIDVSAFAPVESPAADANAPVTFLMIARLLGDKGVREYVAAARAVRATQRNVRFLILGGLDPDNRSAVDADELAGWLADGVVEHLPHTGDVRPWIAAADCVVLPSYREGMPRSLLEGAAMAKPLIATAIPGCMQIARKDQNAFLCQVADPVSLGAAMTRMADLPHAERVAMGAAGRRIAEREFDETIVIERYLEALRRAIGPAWPDRQIER